MTDFNKILDTTTPEIKDSLTIQALKRQEYNRHYQAKLRARAKFITLEKKVDANLQYVIGYIKRKYADEYEQYKTPAEVKISTIVEPENQNFKDWLILSRNEYKSAKHAYELSGLDKYMQFKDFKKLFDKYYGEIGDNKYAKLTD